MRNLRITLLISFVAVVIIACATNPAEPTITAPVKESRYEAVPGTRIGVINTVEGVVTHFHIGTTVFNNFQKNYKVTWNLPAYIDSEVTGKLIGLGYPAKKLKTNQEIDDGMRRLVKRGFVHFSLNPDLLPVLQDLKEQDGVDVLIVFQTYEDRLGGAINNVSGYGFYTESFLGLGNAYPFANISASVINLKEASLIGYYLIQAETGAAELAYPGDVKNISDEEINRAEPYVKGLVNNLIGVVVKVFAK